MARLVCLYIEDNDDAEAFVASVGKPDQVVTQWKGAMPVPLAVFAVPTLYCDCPDPGTNADNKFRISLGQKFGWWIHRECGKPRQHSWQSPRNLLTPAGEFSKVHVNWTFRAPPGHLKPLTQNVSSIPEVTHA